MTSGELRFQVVLDPQGRVPNGAVTFGVTPGDGSIRYDSLRDFYHDLLQGRSFPLALVTNGVQNVSVVVLTALFLHRDLALHPGTPGLVASAELACWGPGGLAHLTPELSAWFRFLDNYLVNPKLSLNELGRRLQQAVIWCRDYLLLGDLPALNWDPVSPRVLDVGTNGFCVAVQDEIDLEAGWIELYRQGFLRGVLWGPNGTCLVARKSQYLTFDLTSAYMALMGMGGEWTLDQDRGFLWGREHPERDSVMQVLVRV